MREKIKLESSAGTGHFYTTTKNKRTAPEKIEIRKFEHTFFLLFLNNILPNDSGQLVINCRL